MISRMKSRFLSRSERLHAVNGGPKIAYRSHLRLLLEHPCYYIVKILITVLSRSSLLKDVSHKNKVFTLVREASRSQWEVLGSFGKFWEALGSFD